MSARASVRPSHQQSQYRSAGNPETNGPELHYTLPMMVSARFIRSAVLLLDLGRPDADRERFRRHVYNLG